MEILQVTRPSPAEQAGLRDGDVLLRIGGYPVADAMMLQRVLRKLTPGARVELELARAGELSRVVVVPSPQ